MIARIRLLVADQDRGSESVGVAILAPVMILLLGLVVVGGRIAIASQSISGVAGNAARDASIARTPAQAVYIATADAMASLAAEGLHCEGGPKVVVASSGFAAPPNVTAVVQVDVFCVVALSDVGMPGLPGARTLHDHAVSVIDPLRSIP